ncbi:MAG: DUF3307 domain-containing protein [Chloroflexota bacterium]|nr:MAG: DUF3307 domain-containing protein [Chloroflexota bacterium]
MFWHLLFAHFVADYPLQPNWMVRNKDKISVLLLHTLIHFIVTVLFVGRAALVIWPYLLALTAAHFIIDVCKLTLGRYRPKWVIIPYVIDQVLHYISIWLVVVWIDASAGLLDLPFEPVWLIYATAYLVATYVWFISERILAYDEPDYREQVINLLWPRMLVRAGILTLFLFGWRLVAGISPSLAVTLRLRDQCYQYSPRAMLTDAGVGLVMLVFVQVAALTIR